jgi:hypothetical protein
LRDAVNLDNAAVQHTLTQYLDRERAGDAQGMFELASRGARSKTPAARLQMLIKDSSARGTSLASYEIGRVTPRDGANDLVNVNVNVNVDVTLTLGSAGPQPFQAILQKENGSWLLDTLQQAR